MFTTRVIRGSPKLTRDLYVLISRSLFQKLSSMSSQKPKVYVTRRVPQDGLEILRPHCEITQWDSEKPVPRDELIRQVAGKDALFCLLTDKIDVDVLNAAGMTLVKNSIYHGADLRIFIGLGRTFTPPPFLIPHEINLNEATYCNLNIKTIALLKMYY